MDSADTKWFTSTAAPKARKEPIYSLVLYDACAIFRSLSASLVLLDLRGLIPWLSMNLVKLAAVLPACWAPPGPKMAAKHSVSRCSYVEIPYEEGGTTKYVIPRSSTVAVLNVRRLRGPWSSGTSLERRSTASEPSLDPKWTSMAARHTIHLYF